MESEKNEIKCWKNPKNLPIVGKQIVMRVIMENGWWLSIFRQKDTNDEKFHKTKEKESNDSFSLTCWKFCLPKHSDFEGHFSVVFS